MTTKIDSRTLADRLQKADSEVALLDVREVAAHATGHMFHAGNMPISRIELELRRAVPRLDTPLVLTDGSGELSEHAADLASAAGYTNIRIHAGGASAWLNAGLPLYPEVDIPSKGFGAYARRYGRPQFISAKELSTLVGQPDVVVLDSRPRAEYQAGNIPGSLSAPAGDLVRCFNDLVPSPDTRVIVNCMSATRGILGGLSLRAAQVPNRVQVLHHGTHGWLLSGNELETGATRFSHTPSQPALRAASTRVSRMLSVANIPVIDANTATAWANDKRRTTYLIDVRNREEFEAVRLATWVNAPEGSVVMHPMAYVPTIGARVLLVDDDGIRAGIAALWLAQIGLWDVAVVRHSMVESTLIGGPDAPPKVALRPELRISVPELASLQANGSARIIDVSPSGDYAAAHIPGARWCSRAEVCDYMLDATFASDTVLTSTDGVLAAHAAREVGARVMALKGGNTAWEQAGHGLTDEYAEFVHPRDDVWLASSERPGDRNTNVQRYLDWEYTLLETLEKDGKVPYRNLLWNA
ncbi:MAG: rhodanese-like domain-containing protein [Pseudomonadota bacterium]